MAMVAPPSLSRRSRRRRRGRMKGLARAYRRTWLRDLNMGEFHDRMKAALAWAAEHPGERYMPVLPRWVPPSEAVASDVYWLDLSSQPAPTARHYE